MGGMGSMSRSDSSMSSMRHSASKGGMKPTPSRSKIGRFMEQKLAEDAAARENIRIHTLTRTNQLLVAEKEGMKERLAFFGEQNEELKGKVVALEAAATMAAEKHTGGWCV